jgi:hypothetical protein
MKARTIVLTLALCFMGIGVCFAQNTLMGTWKLNEAKSKLAPGAPKNNTVIYEPAGDSVKVTIDGTDGAGNPTHSEWTGKFDGKDYPVTGDPNSDSRSIDGRSKHKFGFAAKKGREGYDYRYDYPIRRRQEPDGDLERNRCPRQEVQKYGRVRQAVNYREAGQNGFIATTSDLRPGRDGCRGRDGRTLNTRHRVARSGRPLPAPTERSVPISGTTLVRSRFGFHSTAHACICP